MDGEQLCEHTAEDVVGDEHPDTRDHRPEGADEAGEEQDARALLSHTALLGEAAGVPSQMRRRHRIDAARTASSRYLKTTTEK